MVNNINYQADQNPFKQTEVLLQGEIAATDGSFFLYQSDISKGLANVTSIPAANLTFSIQRLLVSDLTSVRISVIFYEGSAADKDDNINNSGLHTAVSYRTPLQHPTVHYRWPATFANLVHSTKDSQTTLAAAYGVKGDTLVLRATVRWRSVKAATSLVHMIDHTDEEESSFHHVGPTD